MKYCKNIYIFMVEIIVIPEGFKKVGSIIVTKLKYVIFPRNKRIL